MLMVPELLMALVALPNQLVPLTFQVAPAALLNVDVETRIGWRKRDVAGDRSAAVVVDGAAACIAGNRAAIDTDRHA